MGSFPEIIEAFIKKRLEDKNKEISIPEWIDSAAKRASQITVATHVLKYTHSDARGTNILAKMGVLENGGDGPYVSTSSLVQIPIDVVGNAAALDVASFLQIEVSGRNLLSFIEKNDSSPLASFADSEARLQSWMSGFSAVLIDKKLSSDTLAKQVYFPLKEGGYHLLAPLFSSALSQAVYDKITQSRYGDSAKEAREARKKDLLSDKIVIDFPDLAVQMFGGTKPQNISKLNSSRNGKSFLFRSAPPVWRSKLTPPLSRFAFWRELDKQTYLLINEARKFFIGFQGSRNTMELRDSRHIYIEKIIDKLIDVAENFKQFEPGWSSRSAISQSEKIWLDHLNEDLQEIRSLDDWKLDISKQFSRWLIKKIESKQINFKLSEAEYNYVLSECFNSMKAVN